MSLAAVVRRHRTPVVLSLVLMAVLGVLFLTLVAVYSRESRALLLAHAPSSTPGLMKYGEDARHPVHDAVPRRAPASPEEREDQRAALHSALRGDGDAKKDPGGGQVPQKQPSSGRKPAPAPPPPDPEPEFEPELEPELQPKSDPKKPRRGGPPVRGASTAAAPIARYDALLSDTCMSAFVRPPQVPIMIARVVPATYSAADGGGAEDEGGGDDDTAYRPYFLSFPLHWNHLGSHLAEAASRGSFVWYGDMEHKQDLVRDYSEPGDLVIDVGCGGGFSALAMAALDRRVLCIEAMEENAEKIQQSVVANGWSAEQMRVVHAAVVAQPGPVDIFCPIGRGDNCAMTEDAAVAYLPDNEVEVVEVPGVSVDSLLGLVKASPMASKAAKPAAGGSATAQKDAAWSADKVRVLHIAVNGGEGDVLKGAMGLLKRAARLIVLVGFDMRKLSVTEGHSAIDAVAEAMELGYELLDDAGNSLELADLEAIEGIHSYHIVLKKQ
jgi:FkbM family methyltransferase